MLSEKNQLLLSAYVDGDQPNQDRSATERLLRESSEARVLVKKLGDNKKKIKSLPAKSLDGQFANQVLLRLSTMIAVPVAPVLPPPVGPARRLVKKPRLRRGMPAWAVGGIAVLVVGGIVLGGAFWLRNQLDINNDLLPRGNGHTPVVAGKPVSKAESSQEPVAPKPADPLVANGGRGPAETNGDAKADPMIAPKPEPIRFTFGDLQKQNSFDSLKWELAQSSGAAEGLHLDVTVKYNARSLNRIIESFHNQGIPLVVTPPAEASLAKNRPLLVYAENVNADKLALVLRELSEADIQGKKKVASTFESLRVSPGRAEDQARVAEALGIDSPQLKAPAVAAPKAKSIGIVLADDRPQGQANVEDVRRFLAGRGVKQSGALHIYLHLQPNSK